MCVERVSPARLPLVLYRNDNSARDGGRDAVNIEYRCEDLEREKKEREIVGEKKIMERGRVVVGMRRSNSRRERSSLLRGFGRAKSRVPKSTSLPSNPPRAGQSLQLDPPFPLIPLLNFH